MRHDGKRDQDKVLTIKRAGSFEVGWSTHKAQCGYYGERHMTYSVEIRGRETDCPNGWLVDNNDIPAYFTGTYSKVRVFQSCETIASRAVDAFRAKCKEYAARPFYIRVAVSGIAHSEIACEWQSRGHHV